MKSVSCLMITLNRPDLFQRSLRCYCSQTYENKELIIVCDGTAQYKRFVSDTVSSKCRDDIQVVFEATTRLGSLRDCSVKAASGELLCQWDDDDVNHPERLTEQVNSLEELGVDATFLSDHLQVFEDTHRAHMWSWDNVAGEFAHPGTLLAYKTALPAYDKELSTREDLAILQQLFVSGRPIGIIKGMGSLFVYTFHGNNTFARAHHEWLNSLCAVSRSKLGEMEPAIRQACLGYGDVAFPLTFVDSTDSTGFTVFQGQQAPATIGRSVTGLIVAGSPLGKGVYGVRNASDLSDLSDLFERMAGYGIHGEARLIRRRNILAGV